LIAEETLAQVSHATVPGKYLVDLFPWSRLIFTPSRPITAQNYFHQVRYLPVSLNFNFQKVAAQGKFGADWVRFFI
jgi:hypothetical protein